MSRGEGMTSQRRGGAGGNRTDRAREIVGETDAENEMHLLLNKRSDSNMMSGAGKTVNGVRKTMKIILDSQKAGEMKLLHLLLKRRSPILNCQGHSPKIPILSEGWWSSTTSHLRLAFPSEGGDSTLLKMTSLFQSCTFTDRVPICWGGREELLISPLTTHPAPSNTQYSNIGKNNDHYLGCFI